jgi:hypothetical protein
MSTKPNISIRAFARKALLALRTKLNLRPQCTMFQAAQNAGLPVEYQAPVSTKFDGYLDTHTEPRFIAVNPNLPPEDQVFTIARELGYCAQKRRCNSLALDRPWKWKLFESAPEEIREKIFLLDAHHRAHWLMLAFATGDQYRASYKKHRESVFAGVFADTLVTFQLWTLRIQTWIYKIFVVLALS